MGIGEGDRAGARRGGAGHRVPGDRAARVRATSVAGPLIGSGGHRRSIAGALIGAVMFGITVYVPVFVQGVQGGRRSPPGSSSCRCRCAGA